MEEIKIEKISQYNDSYDEFEEEWINITDEPEILGVDASRDIEDESSWTVYISVAEFIREEPLESILFSAISSALNGVECVERVEQEDREAWIVEGKVKAPSLIRACVIQLKELHPKLRAAYDEYM